MSLTRRAFERGRKRPTFFMYVIQSIRIPEIIMLDGCRREHVEQQVGKVETRSRSARGRGMSIFPIPSTKNGYQLALLPPITRTTKKNSRNTCSLVRAKPLTVAMMLSIGMDDSTAAAMRYKDMSLLPTRRQNVACDACRARKVKCVRMPMADKVRRIDRTLEK